MDYPTVAHGHTAGMPPGPVKLRGYIEQAQVERRMTRVPDVHHLRSPAETIELEVQLNPLVDSDLEPAGGGPLGTAPGRDHRPALPEPRHRPAHRPAPPVILVMEPSGEVLG